MKIRHVSEIQRNKNKTFSIKPSRLLNIVAKIFHKITKLLFSHLKIPTKTVLPKPNTTNVLSV